ncbi:MAG: hypothetical protein IKW08_05905 [Roseburia sp.]|nr:hypothetical protein [Roseburia sp.]
MKEIQEIISKFNEESPNWKEWIATVEELDEVYNSRDSELFSELFASIREYVKKDDKKKLEEIGKLIANEKAMDVILKCVNKMLMHYNNLSLLREIEKENKEFVGDFLEDIIENFIVRVDYQFVDEYERYKINSHDEMKTILRTIDCLTEYYVRRIFTKRAIVEDFYDETGLAKENCIRYAEIVNKYFNEMKMNILMQDTEYIRQSMVTKD